MIIIYEQFRLNWVLLFEFTVYWNLFLFVKKYTVLILKNRQRLIIRQYLLPQTPSTSAVTHTHLYRFILFNSLAVIPLCLWEGLYAVYDLRCYLFTSCCSGYWFCVLLPPPPIFVIISFMITSVIPKFVGFVCVCVGGGCFSWSHEFSAVYFDSALYK